MSRLSEVERHVRALMSGSREDAELRADLEALASAEPAFPGLTWLWGPELWRRNRRLFRPFVLAKFSLWGVDGRTSFAVPWKKHAKVLDPWLAEADAADDVELFRKLFAWKHSATTGKPLNSLVCTELTQRFARASSAAARLTVLEKFNLWFTLDEDTALRLHRAEPHAAAPFILRHLPSSFWSGTEKRTLWRRLFDATAPDDDLRWKLYRRQVPLAQWLTDIGQLARTVADDQTLVDELEKHHPEGWGLATEDGFALLLESRGRAVFPYVLKHVASVRRGWMGGRLKKLLDVARKRDWPDLRSTLLRACGTEKEFSEEVLDLLTGAMPESAATQRLLGLCGISREWNFPGMSFARVPTLSAKAAVAMHERRPELLRGPFRLNLQLSYGAKGYLPLLEKLIATCDPGDEDLLDFLASRLVTRSLWRATEKTPPELVLLADHYAAMRKRETAAFSRRAANVLGQVPAFTVWNYGALIRTNPFARLLFERSARSLLEDARALADLVEAPEIHVQALAYRALGCDDDRARAIAQQHLSILQGTLLRPLHRSTRMLAFRALENAAATAETAAFVVQRAREALSLPDKKYPKEELVGLLGRLLHRWPELRGAAEQPLVFRAALIS